MAKINKRGFLEVALRLKEKYQVPLIGVSLAQIWHYCRFRTEAVNLKYHTNYEYLLLDLETFTAINDNRKKHNNETWVGANIPEVIILSDKSIKIVNGNQTEENQEVRGVFGFRCIAKLRQVEHK